MPDEPRPHEPRPDEGRGAWDAIVLAGGAGRRLGGAEAGVVKPEVVVAGRALVDHVLAAVAGARRRVLVAPDAQVRPGVLMALEDPPLGGPVAGIAAGVAALDAHPAHTPPAGPDDGALGEDQDRRHHERAGGQGSDPGGVDRRATTAASDADDVVVVLACDVPRAGLAVPALVAAARRPDVDGARLVDDEGRPQHLVAAYRLGALRRAVAALRDGQGGVRDASVRRLVAPLTFADVPDPGGAAADADTWPAVHRLDAELTLAQRPAFTERAPTPAGRVGAPLGGEALAERAEVHPDDGTIRGSAPGVKERAVSDPRRGPGADLPEWVEHLASTLTVDPALVDVDRILALAGEVAHSVARPAVPISMFVAGLAAAGRTPDEIAALLARVETAAQAWGEERA
ncbi:DUF6457 domain-containing protein [Cellulomonas persica]|uniref:Uncharacterized protein n=1 Tax=Cellulomonas persica TaxID=76861 RepID=A0A510UVR8_9CELL|nr:DUF6457 domain-containing protein [Cellulomonas persica]GEK18777.1 hypothetical protein CPE01_25100 [Cellulomonas persica]